MTDSQFMDLTDGDDVEPLNVDDAVNPEWDGDLGGDLRARITGLKLFGRKQQAERGARRTGRK